MGIDLKYYDASLSMFFFFRLMTYDLWWYIFYRSLYGGLAVSPNLNFD